MCSAMDGGNGGIIELKNAISKGLPIGRVIGIDGDSNRDSES